MRRCAVLFLLPALCMGSSVWGDDVAKSELQLFQGTWQPVFARNLEGKLTSEEDLKSVRLVVKGNQFTLTDKDTSLSGTFTIDASKTPKTIDFRLADSKSPDEKFPGVYEILGERRLSCFALPKQERPRAVRPTEIKGYLMFEWKRAPAVQ